MASPAYVVRIPRSDEKDKHILVGVYQEGSRPLDLRLEATEGLSVYVSSLRQSHIAKSRAKNGPSSDAEWETIVASVLKDGQPITGVEAAATVKEESSITITFRKRIESFGQRIGEFSLDYKEQDIDTIDWCNVAIASREGLKAELASATSKASELEGKVSELEAQLNSLISADREDQLENLEWFRDLLNSKKAKIREQQRILASANLNPDEVASAGPRRSQGAEQHAPESSRTSKRKAKRQAAVVSDEESDDGFEKMDVDQKDVAVDDDGSTDEGNETPTHSDTDEEDEPPQPLSSDNSRRSQDAPKDSDEPPSHNLRGKQPEAPPPPPRRLPFGSSKPGASSASAAATGEGSETDSDDEL